MAKMFYSAEEAAKRLGRTEDQLKDLVREGKLREFRDAGKVNYKVADVDKVANSAPPPAASAASSKASTASKSGASASGEIVLEPVDESGIELSPFPEDVVSLEGTDAGSTASGTTSGSTAAAKAKEDTVVPSVGVNVFDDDDLDEHVDPLAQTAVTDLAGLVVDGMGSGSGILDLTRESDDTSLGKELLEEIYTGEGEQKQAASAEMGEDTRAGLDAAVVPDTADYDEEEEAAAAGGSKVVVRQVVEYGPDPVSSGLTALMFVAVLVMWFAGLAAAAMVRGITPSMVQAIYSNLWMFAAGAVVVGAIAAGVAYFIARRSE